MQDFLRQGSRFGNEIVLDGGRRSMLHFGRVVYRTVALATVFFAALNTAAQSDKSDDAMPADPQIAAALRQVSAQRIQSNIEKLVSFGTRLTISAQDPAAIAAGKG